MQKLEGTNGNRNKLKYTVNTFKYIGNVLKYIIDTIEFIETYAHTLVSFKIHCNIIKNP